MEDGQFCKECAKSIYGCECPSEDDFYQDKIALNAKQSKAFASLERAIAKCKQVNIYFYQSLDMLGALNGDNVRSVSTDSDSEFILATSDHPACLQFKDYPSVETTCSFADDNHFIILHDE